MKTLEWPKGSGRTALYDDDELADARGMIATAAERGIPRGQIAAELVHLHDLKVELAAQGVPVPDDLDLGFDLPPESLTRLPAHIIRERQLDIVIAARRGR